MTTFPDTCCYQGRVSGEHSDASGRLSLDGAVAVIAQALQAHGGAGAEAEAACRAMTLRRSTAAAPRTGELVRVHVTTLDALRRQVRVSGPRGAAWEAELVLAQALPGPAAAADSALAAGLPPLQLMRPMRAADCDQAGHVNVRVFMDLADEATQVLLSEALAEAAPLQIDRVRISFKRELFRDDVVSVHTGVRRIEGTTVELAHALVHAASGTVAGFVETRLAPMPGVAEATVRAAIDGLHGLVDDWPALPPARAAAQPRAGIAAPDGAVVTAMAVVDAWDADAAGHLTLRALVNLCSTGARQYLATIGLTGARFLREQITVAAVDYLITITRRPALGANLTMRTAFLSGSAKSIRFAHHLVDSDDGTAYATVEIVGVMLDLAAHRSMEIPADVRHRLGLA